MSPLSILIVEDNLSFALELEMLVEELHYRTIGRADNSGEALDLIFSKNPDLILMDIDIKGNLSGLEIGEKIAHLNIPILYITGLADQTYEQALKQKGTIGYLVKPVDKITLRSSINLAIAKAYTLQSERTEEGTPTIEHFIGQDHLFLKKKGTYRKVAFGDIVFIKSNDNYCEVHTAKEDVFTARMPLSKFGSLLPHKSFFRPHRQYIVQTSFIESVNFQDSTITVMHKEIPLSRENKKELEALIHKIA